MDTATETTAAPAGFESRALALQLTLNRYGTRRKVGSSQIEADADKTLLHVSKDIIDSPELQKVAQLDGQIRAYLFNTALPSFFKAGIYLVPIASVEEVSTQLGRYDTERRALIETFLAVYETRVREARARLRDLYRTADYKSLDEVRASFGFSYRYLTLGAPGELANISKSLFDAEAAKARNWWEEAKGAAQNALREACAGLVDHLVDRLKARTDDGKPQVLRETTVTKLLDFLDSFAKRNIADDDELQSLVATAKAVLQDVDINTLRKDEDVRARVLGGFEQVKSQLDGLLIDRPSRPIIFEDDDEGPIAGPANPPASGGEATV